MHFLAFLALAAVSLATFVTAAPVSSSPLDGDVAVLNRDFNDSDNPGVLSSVDHIVPEDFDERHYHVDLERRAAKGRASSPKPATPVKATPKTPAKVPPSAQKKPTVNAPSRAPIKSAPSSGKGPVKASGKPTTRAPTKAPTRPASINKVATARVPARKPLGGQSNRNAVKPSVKAPSQRLPKAPAVVAAKNRATSRTNGKKPVAPLKGATKKPTVAITRKLGVVSAKRAGKPVGPRGVLKRPATAPSRTGQTSHRHS
ncbi:hypothetical protein H1R20_g10541, partial [Candolleomyces eurysporus]